MQSHTSYTGISMLSNARFAQNPGFSNSKTGVKELTASELGEVKGRSHVHLE